MGSPKVPTQKDGASMRRLGAPAPAPGFAKANSAPHGTQLKYPGAGAPKSGQTARPAQPGIAKGHAHRQGGRRGSTGGGAKE